MRATRSSLSFLAHFGFRDDGSVPTYFDLIEMDLRRWYPECCELPGSCTRTPN